MKIFFASQSFYPHIGGVSTYLLNLAIGLIKRGNEVIEVHLRPPHEASEDIIKSIKVFRIPKEPLNNELLKGYSNFKERIYRECHGEGRHFEKEPLITNGYDEYHEINQSIGEQIEELLEKNPTEIVHIHDFQLLLIYRNIQRGIPVLLTWHIPFVDSISKHLKEFLIRHMKEFDKVIFSCKEYAQSAIRAGLSSRKVQVIHPIANTNLFRPKKRKGEIKEQYAISKDHKLVLCVQRIDSKSGHIQLIHALKKVIEKFPFVKLMFVGGESLTNKISDEREKYINEVYELIKKLGIQDSIIFTGNIPYEELPKYYNEADIVALTSKNEGFGLAITEGMACKKPIIGTNVPGIAAQVQDGVNGFLVDVSDYEKTAEKILELLTDDHLRDTMGNNGFKISREHFGIAVGIEQHSHLYRELIKQKTDLCLEKIKLESISAIVTDFDRTITDKPGVIDEKVVQELKMLGKPLILVTGRPIDYVRDLSKKYPVFDCIISENGSCIFFPSSNLLWTFTSDYFQKAKAMVQNSDVPFTCGSSVISIPKVHERRLKDLLNGLKNSLNFRENVDEIMVLPKDVDKGTSLKLVLQYLNIEPKKTIIIGDAENDIDLFSNPGYKIAVANASEKLKLFADEVTENPSAQGVLEIIGKLKM